MIYHSKFAVVPIFVLVLSQLFFGCISYQMLKRVDGNEFNLPDKALRVGEATLETALLKLGAPDQIVNIEGRDVLLYQRIVFRQNRLSLSIPLLDVWSRGVELSAFGGLESYDTLALFFTPDKVLRLIVVEKSADRPYLKTMFEDKGSLQK